jgi:GH24 family phage-related lysozyme (muramidase)
VLGLLSLILPELRFYFSGRDSDPYFLWSLGLGFTVAGIVLRPLRQSSALVSWAVMLAVTLAILALSSGAARGDAKADRYNAQEAAVFAIWLPHAEVSEGVRLQAYLDPVGIPTICMGSTRVNGQPVRMGMKMTLAECRALFAKDARSHRNGLLSAYTGDTIVRRLPPARDAALADMAFNLGIGATAKSTAMRRLNNGDVAGACTALTWYNKAGGRIMRGLVKRVTWRADQCRVGLV